MVNAACALVVLPLAFASTTPAGIDSGRNQTAVAPPGASPAALPARFHLSTLSTFSTFSTWVVIYAFAGFLALSFEIVWFRTLGVMMKSTAFTFGTLLMMYLGTSAWARSLATALPGASGDTRASSSRCRPLPV
jgi:spermidine synthase